MIYFIVIVIVVAILFVSMANPQKRMLKILNRKAERLVDDVTNSLVSKEKNQEGFYQIILDLIKVEKKKSQTNNVLI